MADLVTWLRAVLDDIERVAKDAISQGGRYRPVEGTWIHDDPPGRQTGLIADGLGNVVTYDAGSPSAYQAEHIALHDPTAVLRDIAAKRRIVDHCAERLRDGEESADAETDGMVSVVVRLLALPHVDREGYREEWRPT